MLNKNNLRFVLCILFLVLSFILFIVPTEIASLVVCKSKSSSTMDEYACHKIDVMINQKPGEICNYDLSVHEEAGRLYWINYLSYVAVLFILMGLFLLFSIKNNEGKEWKKLG